MLTMSWRVDDGALVVNDGHATPMLVVHFRASWTNDEKRAVVRAILSAIDAIHPDPPVRYIEIVQPKRTGPPELKE